MAINDEKQARHGKHEVQRVERCKTRQDQTAAELISCVRCILVALKRTMEPVFAVLCHLGSFVALDFGALVGCLHYVITAAFATQRQNPLSSSLGLR